MALSVYLTQTLIQLAVFSGVGLGLAGRVPLAWLPVVAAGILATQRYACAWWLRRHAQGPAEWAWRRATYGRRLPVRWPRLALRSHWSHRSARPYVVLAGHSLRKTTRIADCRDHREPFPSVRVSREVDAWFEMVFGSFTLWSACWLIDPPHAHAQTIASHSRDAWSRPKPASRSSTRVLNSRARRSSVLQMRAARSRFADVPPASLHARRDPRRIRDSSRASSKSRPGQIATSKSGFPLQLALAGG